MEYIYRSPPDGFLTSGQGKHEVELEYLDLYPCAEVFICEDNVLCLSKSPPDGFLTSGQGKHEVELEYLDLYPCAEVFICEDNVLCLSKPEELNTMSTGEDEPSASLNGRLRPRKSTSTTPSPQSKLIRKTEGKLAQDRPKRTSVASKASPAKQDDLFTKSYAAPAPLFLCPYCDKTFNAKQTASKHAKRIHLSTSKQDNFIKCLYCNNSDAESNAIIKHMVDSHPNQYFACLDCHTRFPSTTELAEHKHNVCEKQKPSYRSKLRQNSSPGVKKNPKNLFKKINKTANSNESTQLTDDLSFDGIVISCELKPSDTISDMHDAADIEDKITTNLILPSSKTLGNTPVDKNAVIVLDDLQWNKHLPPNFSFRNSDADQILSRLGVVHRSPRVGESRKDLIRLMDEPNEKFEKCFDTSFYSKVAKNVQENLAKHLDGTFNFNPNKDTTLKTRKAKASVTINTAEGFPILLAHEQFSRNLFDGFITRAMAPKHKWKWDTAENDKNLVMLLDQNKQDSHVNHCIITSISSLDIWSQLRMKSKFEETFKTVPAAKKTEKQNIISMELKEILESRDIPSTSSQVVQYKRKPVESSSGSELPAYLGLSARSGDCELQPAVLSGEWVRPRCYVCCACGDQTRDARTLSAHLAAQHPNAQVQHYEIVGETLLRADILKHLYVPPSQISNRTRPPRGIRDCTKCKKSVTLEELHQHMLDCAGDTPTVRRKCRYRPFGVRRRRPRLPDNTIRKKIRKDIRSRHRQKTHLTMRPRPKTRTEVGDAETIRKMIADLPAKRNRITSSNVVRPRRTVLKTKNQGKHRSSEDKKSKLRPVKRLNKPNKTELAKKQNDTDNSSSIDEDDQPLKLSVTRVLTRTGNGKKIMRRKAPMNNAKKKIQSRNQNPVIEGFQPNFFQFHDVGIPPDHILLHLQKQKQNAISYEAYARNLLVLQASQLPPPPPPPTQGYGLRSRGCMAFRLQMANAAYYHQAMDHEKQIAASRACTELANEMPHIQLPQESLHESIDVKGAGPSNIRQHSGRYNNMRSSRVRSAGGGNDRNQNNNIAQTPNVPLKHSIASLTSDTEGRNASMSSRPINNPYLFPNETNTRNIHESAFNRIDFENEATVDKVDKPPLTTYRTQPKKTNKQWSIRNNEREACDLSTRTLSPCDLTVKRIPIIPPQPTPPPPPLPPPKLPPPQLTPLQLTPPTPSPSPPPPPLSLVLSNELVESRVASEQKFLQKKSVELQDCIQQLPLDDFKESQKFVAQLPMPNDTKNLAEHDADHKIAHLNTEIKIETEKTKSSRNRKGLNDCIAMLRTKCIRLDKASGQQGVHENADSDKTDKEIATTEAGTAVDSDLLSGCKTTEENINVAPSDSFSGKGSSVTDVLPDLSDKSSLEQKKLPISEHESLKPESELNLTKFSHPKENDITSELSPVKGIPTKPNKSVLSEDFVDATLDLTISQNMRCNSQGEVPIREELNPLFDDIRENQAIETTIDFNMSNLTQAMNKDQTYLMKEKDADIDMELLHKYNDDDVDEMQNPQNTPESVLLKEKAAPTTNQLVITTAQTDATSALTVPQIDLSAEDSIDEKIQPRQSNVSPTARRTRRKPIKKKPNLEQQPELNSEQTISLRLKTVPVDLQQAGSNPVDSNTLLLNSDYLPSVSPSHETLPLKTPPPPPLAPSSMYFRRGPCKRVLKCPKTGATVVENKDNISQTKTAKTSSETYAENIMNIHNLRHSIDLANAQIISANYNNILAHSFNEKCENSTMGIFQAHREIPHPSNISPNYCINDNARYDKANEMLSRYSSTTTFVSTTPDTRGIMHVNPQALSANVNLSNSFGPPDNYQTTHDNEHFSVHRQRSDYLEAKGDHSKSKSVKKYSSQKNKGVKQNPSALETNSHLSTARRHSDVYYNRSPYQHNVSNINTSNNFLEMGFDKNTEIHDKSLRDYPASIASFPPLRATFSNKQQNAISLLPPLSCEPNVEEMAPLDLSCDAKSRKDQTLHPNKQSPDVSKTTCNVSIANDKHKNDVSVNPAFRSNFTGQLHTLPQPHSRLSSESESIEEHFPQFDSNVSLQKSENKNLEISSQKHANQPALITSNAQSDTCANFEHLDRSFHISNKNIDYDDETTNKTGNIGHANNYSIDQLQSLPPEGNFFMPHESPILNSLTMHQKERKQEKTVHETTKITLSAAQINVEAKSEDTTSRDKTPYVPTNALIHNVENMIGHGSYPYMGHCMASPNVPSANDMNSKNSAIVDTKSNERNVQISNHEILSENDNIQIEVDAETARKIALLPEELVKILGTIPKDHRNQLLNVLPQYVSTPLLNMENDKKNSVSSIDVQKNTELREDIEQNTSAGNDSNKLSFSAAISPSSVIPKKRLSPLHSRGRLNSSELQSTGPILPPSLAPTLSTHLPIGHNESVNNSNAEVSASLGIFHSATPTQDLSFKLPTKQKPSNEQTASLRAVRIKTTSTKKSFPDDKKLQANSGYITNLTVGEKYLNLGQAISPGHNACVINLTDSKYENEKLNNKEIEINCDTDKIVREATKESTDCSPEKSNIIEAIIINDTNVENDDNFTHNVPQNTSEFQIKSNVMSHDIIKNLQSKNTITVEPSSLSVQNTNTDVDHFLEQMNSTKLNIPEDDVSTLKHTNIMSNSSSKTELQDITSIQFERDENVFTPVIQSPEKNINIAVNKKQAEKYSNNNEEVIPLSSTSTKNDDVIQDKTLKDAISNKSYKSPSVLEIKNANDVSTKNYKSYEDDSEDDITLAVIKKKHCKAKKITKKYKISHRNKRKNKRNKLKGVAKRQKKKSKCTEILQKSVLSNDVVSNNELIHPVDTEITFNEINEDTCGNPSNILPSTSEIDKVINSVIENEDSLTSGPNNVEPSLLDISINKNEHKETSNTIVDLQPEQIVKFANTEIPNLLDLNDTQNVEFYKTYVCLDESQSNSKKINSNKSEIKYSMPDVDTKNMPDNKDVNDLKDVSTTDSTKITTLSTPIDSITSDFQLCSEIPEVNTLSLRRSRRGKSMYVDSSYIEDCEQIEDRTKTPLTMKRLILSRVEKEKKRISESSTFEQSCDATYDHLSITSEAPDISCAVKAKLSKRKKSPYSKRISKKIKEIGLNEHEEKHSDLNDLHSTPENNICILRELPNADNNITGKDFCSDDLKCAISDNCSSKSEITTIVSNEKESNEAGDDTIEIQEIPASIKRKLTPIQSNDLVLSKSKKTKYHKKKPHSDFDSDDDKVLQETKQEIATEKHLKEVHDCGNMDKEKEDNNEKSPKSLNEACNDIVKPTAITNASSETRITCYSGSISKRRPRSSSISFRDSANYDPYDIDFIDMLETSAPVIKKKGKNTKNKQSAKLHHGHKLNVPKEDLNNSTLKESKQTVTKIHLIATNESDSDSSKSDVPLQKYVDEKTSKLDSKSNKNSNESTDETEKTYALESNQNCLDITQILVVETSDDNNDGKTCNISNAEHTSSKSKKSTKRVTTDDNMMCESDSPIIDVSPSTNNNTLVDQTTPKQSSKQKKTRRTPVVCNIDPAVVSNEDDQQQRSDKFMEKFGFYSERIPRKSNLLASKKISETFHLISNEGEDSVLIHKDKSKKSTRNESKKKLESGSNVTTSQDPINPTGEVTVLNVQSLELEIDNCLAKESPNEPDNVVKVDSSEGNVGCQEFTYLESNLFYKLTEVSEGRVARNSVRCQNTINLETTAKEKEQNGSIPQPEATNIENPESTKKNIKSKQNKLPIVKDKMYPDIEEIDMFEDKFDKIKRKRRSQAVAAKQVQLVAETNTSAKSRKKSERKKSTKSAKKNYQNTQVPTKGALKVFEGIKISIPTQDLIMPNNVSPPRQSKKRRKTKRRKESDSDSTCSELDDKDKSGLERDIYEFKDSEDTELFDLRPSTVMNRFKSMHNKNKIKNKDKEKDIEKEKVKSRERERKTEVKDSINFEALKERDKHEKGKINNISREERRVIDKDIIVKEINYCGKNSDKSMDDSCLKLQKGFERPSNYEDDNDIKKADSAIASTSGFIPDRVDESDYESEMSSPEGDFIFYMSNDTNCICPSDNDSSDSDVERGCGRLNCVSKNRNADKNTAIGNIFKNNAVRCEKPDIKVPDKPKPNFDQLFDSLLETESKPKKSDTSENQKDIITSKNIIQSNINSSIVAQRNQTDSKDYNTSLLNNEMISIFDESYNATNICQSLPTDNKNENKNLNTDKHSLSKSDYISSLCQNDILTDSGSMQIFSIDNKQKQSVGYSLMSEESTQVNFTDIIAHESETKDETITNFTNNKATKTGASKLQKSYSSEDEFDINKPEALNRQFMHLILPAEKTSTCVQTDNRIDNSDAESGNESAAPKYLKELSPTQAAKTEIYTMVSSQSTQTSKSTRHERDSSKHDSFSKSEDEIDILAVPKALIRLQKYDTREIAHKITYTKSVQTDTNKDYKPPKYDYQTESDDDVGTVKDDHADEESDLIKGGTYTESNMDPINFYHGDKDETLSEDVDEFTTPISKFPGEKHSPRKSDEGISTSYDYSAEAFDQSFDNAGVAHQRARRKCTVGKQNVLAEHWSSESEFDGGPPRPNSADSVVASASRKKKSRKKDGHHLGGRKARHQSKGARGRVVSGGRSDEIEASGTRGPSGPKMRVRAAHYWSSEGEEPPGPQPQHGWIVGDSHKKLVTMLAHAKGRKRNHADKHVD